MLAHRPRLGQKLAATREEEEAGRNLCEARIKPRVQVSCFGTLGYSHVQLTFGDEDALVIGSMRRSQKLVNNAQLMDWTGTTRNTDAKETGQEHSNPGAAGKVSRVI